MMVRPPRFETWQGCMFFNFNVTYDRWFSDTVGCEFHAYECDFIRIGFESKFFGVDDVFYDGNKYKGFVFLGVAVGRGHAVDIEEVEG